MFIFLDIGDNHPNCHMFQRGCNHQPDNCVSQQMWVLPRLTNPKLGFTRQERGFVKNFE